VTLVRRLLLVLAAGLALVSGAAGAPVKEPAPLYGLLERAGRDDLVRLDRSTLRPLGQRLDVGEYRTAWAFSPDRSKLALGWSYTATLGRVGAVRIVDLRRWRSERVIPLHGELSSLQAASWVGDRLVLLVSYPRDSDVIALDPRSGRVLGRRMLEGLVSHAAPTVRGLTLLMSPRTGLGPARVVRVDAALHVHTVTLDRLSIGPGVTETQEGQRILGRSNYGGFALRSGAAAPIGYVLAAGAPPAVVDLRSLSVQYAASRILAARTKSAEGSWRFAHWTGADSVVYGGMDYSADGGGKRMGVDLLDTRTWNRRSLDPNATAAAIGSGLVLTWDSWPAAARTLGVRGFGADGAVRFAALKASAVGDVEIAGLRALVRLSGTRPIGKVLDLRTGTVVATLRGNVPRLLAGRAAAW
jgi:hypothetical protein